MGTATSYRAFLSSDSRHSLRQYPQAGSRQDTVTNILMFAKTQWD